MIREELKQLSTGPRELRKFGLMVGGVFVLLGAWFTWRHKPWGVWFLGIGGLLILGGGLFPKSLKQIYIGWMAMAFVMGIIVSTMLLTLFFYLVITPVGMVARLFGKDFLNRRINREMGSYWLLRPASPKTPTDYERQF